MHRFTDTYTISYTTTFQFFVYQGFSHHLPITQTTYTSHHAPIFVQHSTQPCNRYSYALNNPLRYKDPSGEAFIADDVLAAVIGGVLNVVVNRQYISSFGDAFGYFTIGAMGGILNYYTFGIAGSALVTYYNGSMQGVSSGQITRNVIASAIGGAVSYGSITLMGAIAPNYDNISNLAGRYAAKVGYSAMSGFISGASYNFVSQLSLSVMDPNYEPSISSFWRSGFMGAAISGGLSAGFSVYDYFTWDRYTPEQKMEILNNEMGNDFSYLSFEKYMDIKAEAVLNGVDPSNLPESYNNLYGLTIGQKGYITDKGLMSKQIAEITYTHEYSHVLDNIPNIVVPNEAKAFLMESKIYNALTQYRYIDTRSLYVSHFFNKVMNIIR